MSNTFELRAVGLTLDCHDPEKMADFWQAARLPQARGSGAALHYAERFPGPTSTQSLDPSKSARGQDCEASDASRFIPVRCRGDDRPPGDLGSDHLAAWRYGRRPSRL